MGWDHFSDRSNKSFLVNWVGVRGIIRSYLHSKAMWDNSKVTTETHIFGPDLQSVEVNFDRVRQTKDSETEDQLRLFYETAVRSMPEAVSMLEQMIDRGKEYDRRYSAQSKMVSAETMKNINQSVDRGEIALESAKLVRDLSAETLLVGATFMSGGAALLLIGGGAALKGTAKYQDTGNAKAAIAEGVFTAGFGVLGLKVAPPSSAAAAEKIAVNIYLGFGQAAADPLKSWIGGDAVAEGLATGGIKMGAAPLTETIKELTSDAGQMVLRASLKSDTKLKVLALPIQAGLNVLVDRGAGAIPNIGKNNPPQNIPKQAQEALLDTVTPNRQFIESCAVKQNYSGT